MSDLRNQIIKLAHDKPELRSSLLPLLKEAKQRLGDSGAISEMLDAYAYVKSIKANSWTSVERNLNEAVSLLMHAKRKADHRHASNTADRMIDYVGRAFTQIEGEINATPLDQWGGIPEYSFATDIDQLKQNIAIDIHDVISTLIGEGVPLDPSLEAEVQSVKLPGRFRWHMLK